MALLLRCTLCGRTQADGLLSRAAWGHVVLESGRAAQACPRCKQEDNWEHRVRTIANERRVGGVLPPERRA